MKEPNKYQHEVEAAQKKIKKKAERDLRRGEVRRRLDELKSQREIEELDLFAE